MTWHARDDVLELYATASDAVDDVTAASVEMHVLECEQCRAQIAAMTPAPIVADSWDAVADRIDAPSRTVIERLLRALGIAESHARLVSATRSLQGAWLASIAVIVAGVVALAQEADNNGPFLVIAPLLPLASVAAAFAAGADPAGEAGSAAPLSGTGLVLRRAVAVLSASLLAVALGSLALPDLDLHDAGWVLPALGLSVAALALATWIRVEAAAAVLAAVWCGALFAAASSGNHRGSIADMAPFMAIGQLSCLALIAISLAVLANRRDAIATVERIT